MRKSAHAGNSVQIKLGMGAVRLLTMMFLHVSSMRADEAHTPIAMLHESLM